MIKTDVEEEAKVFLSYSREDRERASDIADALRSRHFAVFKDTDDIFPTEEWRTRLGELIEEADTILFLLSPHSAASEVCAWEVDYATSLNKRIAPLVIEDVERNAIPPLLARLNFIFCTPRDTFESAVDTLASALSTDIDWIREHTRLAGLARRWAEAGRPARLLLRGQDIADAEGWRDGRPKEAPAVTSIQAAYAAESRKAAGRRQRTWIAGSLAAAVFATLLAVFAYFQSVEADRQRAEAVKERNAALLNESRFLAGMSSQMMDEGRAAEALALAWEGLPKSDPMERPLSAEAARALREARLSLREVARLSGQGEISSLHFSPNGEAVATGDRDGGVLIRRSDDGAEIARLSGHPGGEPLIAWGANSAILMTGGMDWTPRLWNAVTGEKLADVFGLKAIVSAVAISKDATRIAAAGTEGLGSKGQVAMWDLKTGLTIGPLEGVSDHIHQLAFSPDSAFLAGMEFGRLVVWRASDGEKIYEIGDTEDLVAAFAFHPNRRLLAVGRFDGHIEIRGVADGVLQAENVDQHGAAITRLVFSEQGWMLGATDLLSGYATLLHGENAARLAALMGHENRLTDIAFSPDGEVVITGSLDGAARLWTSEGRLIATLGGHVQGAKSVAFDPRGGRIATVSGAGVARLWAAPAPLAGSTAEGGDWYALAVGFGPDGAPRAVLRNQATRFGSGFAEPIELPHNLDAEVAAISPDGAQFAVAGKDGRVKVFDFDTGEAIGKTTLPDQATALGFAEDGQLLIGLKGGGAYIWTPGDVIGPLGEGEGDVLSIRRADGRIGVLRQNGLTIYSEDGMEISRSEPIVNTTIQPHAGLAADLSRFAMQEPDGGLAIRHADGGLIRRVETGFESLYLIEFTADGAYLTAGGPDGLVMLIDAATGAPFLRIDGAGDRIIAAAVAGAQILTGDHKGNLTLRPLFMDPVSAIAEAGKIVERLRPLSRADRCRFFLDAAEACTALPVQ